MTPEGRIVINLFPGAKASAVRIASTRPLTMTRQFAGHAPDKVVQTISLLFAACKAAQTIVAAEAFEDALGIEPPASTKKARAALILAETAREHALRILIDWPKFLGAAEEPDAAMLRSVIQADRKIAAALDGNGEAFRIGGKIVSEDAKAEIMQMKALLERAIFRCDLDDCCAMSRDEVGVWAQDGHTAAQRLIRRLLDEHSFDAGATEVLALPAFENGAIAERLLLRDADAFVAEPEWEGSPRETSALARTMSHPLVKALNTPEGYGLGARLVACLVELAQIPARMLALIEAFEIAPSLHPAPNGNGVGVAQVEAARGRLVHALKLEGGQVACYRILAPTEWSFHPEGAVAQGLGRIAAAGGEVCAWTAELFVMSADPCVGADVRVL